MTQSHIKTRVEDIFDPVTGKPVMKVRVDEIRDELSPERIAIRLAEAIDQQGKALGDERAFSAQADDDRRKAQRLQTLIFDIEHGRAEPKINPKTGKPYRMQMIDDHDPDVMREEMEMRRARAQEFAEKANFAKAIAEKARREVARLQSELARARRG